MSIPDKFAKFEFVNPETLFGAVFYGIIFLVAAWLANYAIAVAIHRLQAKDKYALVDRTLVRFLGQLIKFGVYILAFIAYAHLIPGLSKLGTFGLTGVSIVSVIVGLAAQNTLSNLIAGVTLLLYRPFSLGDRLQVTAPTGLETGVVESLNLGYTVLKTDDNRRVVLPNSALAGQTTINLSSIDPRVIGTMPVSISYDSNVDQARGILIDLARQHPKVQAVCGCPISQLGSSSIVLNLAFWCADSSAASGIKSDLLEQALKRFAAEKIEIPYPYTRVILTESKS